MGRVCFALPYVKEIHRTQIIREGRPLTDMSDNTTKVARVSTKHRLCQDLVVTLRGEG
jgi:hypothetical protein